MGCNLLAVTYWMAYARWMGGDGWMDGWMGLELGAWWLVEPADEPCEITDSCRSRLGIGYTERQRGNRQVRQLRVNSCDWNGCAKWPAISIRWEMYIYRAMFVYFANTFRNVFVYKSGDFGRHRKYIHILKLRAHYRWRWRSEGGDRIPNIYTIFGSFRFGGCLPGSQHFG